MEGKKRKPVLLDIKAVGELLGMKESTVRKLVKLGQLRRPRMCAGSPRWFPIDVKVYLARLQSGEFDGCETPQEAAKSRERPQKPPKSEPS